MFPESRAGCALGRPAQNAFPGQVAPQAGQLKICSLSRLRPVAPQAGQLKMCLFPEQIAPQAGQLKMRFPSPEQVAPYACFRSFLRWRWAIARSWIYPSQERWRWAISPIPPDRKLTCLHSGRRRRRGRGLGRRRVKHVGVAGSACHWT